MKATTTGDNPVLTAARAYVAAGLSVIPIRTDGSKAPVLHRWRSFMSARPDHAHLAEWFGEPGPAIAIVAGAASGNLEVLDFDEPGLFEQFSDLCVVRGLGGLLATMPVVLTPRAGRHVYYRIALHGAAMPRSCKLAQDPAGKARIETRADGAYAIAPPSAGTVHPLGGAYELLSGAFDKLPLITQAQRSELLNCATAFDLRRSPSDAPGAPEPADQSTSAAPTPIDWYNANGDYAAVLRRHGWALASTHRTDGSQDWRRPDKADGHSATWGHNGCRLLHVFSTNALPLEADQRYSAFDILRELDHSGDMGAAVAAAIDEARRSGVTLRSPGFLSFACHAALYAMQQQKLITAADANLWVLIGMYRPTPFPARETLAKRTGRDVGTVRKSVLRLEHAGILEVIPRPGFRAGYGYRLTDPATLEPIDLTSDCGARGSLHPAPLSETRTE